MGVIVEFIAGVFVIAEREFCLGILTLFVIAELSSFVVAIAEDADIARMIGTGAWWTSEPPGPSCWPSEVARTLAKCFGYLHRRCS